jgi:hypothetical protein
MRKIIQWMLVIGLAFAPVLSSAPAEAALSHTWVASTGSDSNNCDRPTPCATFSGAYGKTAAEGEITCVDSGNYGGITITTSITINCENAIGSDTVSGGNSFNIFNITTPAGAAVVLRGLDFNALGAAGSSGQAVIMFNGAGVLHLHKVRISYALGGAGGIFFNPNGAATLDISDSYITDNGTSGTGAGIYVKPASGIQAYVSINRTQIENNYFGIVADGNQGGIINGTISDSVVSGNIENGITASTTSSNVLLLIDQTKVSGNIHGLVAGGSTAAMMVRNTTVTGNTAAGLFTVNGGALYSYGNNSVDGNNGNNGAFTGPATLK